MGYGSGSKVKTFRLKKLYKKTGFGDKMNDLTPKLPEKLSATHHDGNKDDRQGYCI
jgi:hypothetical protein